MSFTTAISGLKAATTELDVTGNNIANGATTGFKESRADFAEVFATSATGASSNSVGSGVRLSQIAQQFTQGNITFTNNNLDLAINGEGFFTLDDNGTQVYSRAGAFGVDKNGVVVNADNQSLVVFQADASGNVTGATGNLTLTTGISAPQATTAMTLGLNLDSTAVAPVTAFNPSVSNSFNSSTSATIYDSLGAEHLATTYYRKTAANTWETYLYVDGAQVDGPDNLVFSGSGALTTPATGILTTASFTPSGGAAPMTLALNYGSSTQYGSAFGVNAITVDGFSTGQLTGVDIDSEGIVFARFTNGQSLVQGQVVLANFANTGGLNPLGSSTWQETASSGTALLGGPGSSSLGLIQSGALEDSNVELSEQLVKLIIAQRNYQANSKVISTSDEITQSIINIR